MTTSPPNDDDTTSSNRETPLSDVSDALDEAGFAGQFRPEPGAEIECLTCHRQAPAAIVPTLEMTRLEGESDPADMAMVVAVRCPACGTKGTLVLNYGPDASAEEADVLVALERSPR